MSIVTPEMTVLEVTILPDGRMDRRNAAIYCGLSPKTLAMHACYGTGPAYIKRGRIWYKKEDLDAWLAAGRATSTASARLVSDPPTK